MSDKKPIVLGSDGRLQQVQPGDQVDPSTLPFDDDKNTRRLFRLLLADLALIGFPLRPELLDELSKLNT